MTQTKTRASHFKGRLFKSAATSALALSAVAAGAILSGGEAKALQCNFVQGTTGDQTFTDCSYGVYYDTNPAPSDKQIKFIKGPTTNNVITPPLTGTVDWYVQQGPKGPVWQVDVDWGPNIDFNAGQPGQSIFEYIVKITDPHYYFDKVSLDSTFGFSPNNASVKKEIYTVVDHGPGTLKATLDCIAGNICPVEVDISDHHLQALFIRDTAATDGQLIDNYQNSFTQKTKKVPAPLPILGAAAAFGSVRKARKFSAHLKSFSMG